jgi:hypothetical protein
LIRSAGKTRGHDDALKATPSLPANVGALLTRLLPMGQARSDLRRHVALVSPKQQAKRWSPAGIDCASARAAAASFASRCPKVNRSAMAANREWNETFLCTNLGGCRCSIKTAYPHLRRYGFAASGEPGRLDIVRLHRAALRNLGRFGRRGSDPRPPAPHPGLARAGTHCQIKRRNSGRAEP